MGIPPQTDAGRMAYWQEYYDEVVEATADSDHLDYPSTRQQVETLTAALKVGGEIAGHRVMDAGCGRGQLAVMCTVLGASKVVAWDYTAKLRDANKARWPEAKVDWRVGSLADPASYQRAGEQFDTVFCIEAAHTVPTSDAMRGLWRSVAPGGRLVAIFTNADNPVADLAAWRNGGVPYFAIGEAGLNPMLRSLGGVATWRVEGFHWADDQRVEVFDSRRAYEVTPAPYNWLVVAVKAG